MLVHTHSIRSVSLQNPDGHRCLPFLSHCHTFLPVLAGTDHHPGQPHELESLTHGSASGRIRIKMGQLRKGDWIQPSVWAKHGAGYFSNTCETPSRRGLSNPTDPSYDSRGGDRDNSQLLETELRTTTVAPLQAERGHANTFTYQIFSKLLKYTVTDRPNYPIRQARSFWKLFIFRTACLTFLLDLKFTLTF